jgi:hypothetical protein
VGASGDTIVVGAPSATVSGHANQGAAYLFVKPAGGWTSGTETAKLTASDGAANHNLGFSVGVSGDTVAAGASGNYGPVQGAAYVFVKPAGGWTTGTETDKLAASDGSSGDAFGQSLGVDGSVLVAGAPNARIASNSSQGAVYVFNAAPTSTTVNCTPSPVTVGQPTTCTATVSNSGAGADPTGSVSFSSDSSGSFDSGTKCTLASTGTAGSSSCSVNYTPSAVVSGTHTITATYAGDGAHAPSSGQTTVTVTAGGMTETSTSVACVPVTVGVGQPTTCTATVSNKDGGGSDPTGSVVFSSDSSGSFDSNATCDLVSTGNPGSVSCGINYTPSAAGSGTQRITGSYGGDTTHDISGGFTTVTVPGPTDTTAGCVPGSVAVGETITCTATVANTAGSGSAPTGSVSFSSDSSGSFDSEAICTLANAGTPGSASCSLTYTPSAVGSGTHTITASYGGDTSHDASGDVTSVNVTAAVSIVGGGGGNPPITAIDDQGVSHVLPSSLTLSAAGSSPGGGTAITDYTWSIVSGSGGTNSFDCGGASSMSFAANTPGTYQVAVTATNNLGVSATSTMAVNVPAGLVSHGRAGAVAAAVVGAPGAWAVACSSALLHNPYCATSFQFGIIDVAVAPDSSECFSINEQPLPPNTPGAAHDASFGSPAAIPRSVFFQYTATVRGAIDLNGLPLHIPDSHISTFRTPSATDGGSIIVATEPLTVAGLSLGSLSLTHTFHALTYNETEPIGDFSVGGGGLFEGLPVKGGASLTLAYQRAIIGAQVSLPDFLSVAGGSATLSGTVTVANDKPNAYTLHAGFSDLNVGVMEISDVTVDYDSAKGELKIGGNVDIGGAKVELTPVPPNGVLLKNNQFAGGGLNFVFPDCCQPELFPGITLKSIGAALNITPTVLQGDIGLEVLHLGTVNGQVLTAFPSQSAPFRLTTAWLSGIPDNLNGQVFVTSPLIGVSATVGVDVPVIGTLNLGQGYIVFTPGYLWAGGGVDFNILGGVLDWGGGMDGAFSYQTGAFDVEGYVHGSIADFLKGSIHAVVSSQGAGACADVFGEGVGGGVQWNGGSPKIYLYPPLGKSCVFERFTEDHVFGAADVAQALRPFHIHIRRGAPSQAIRLEGSGGAPAVRVTGPGGIALTSPSGAGLVHSGSVAILRSLQLKVTEIGLRHPRAGTYTITPLPGSVPIASVATALAPPAASMRARVVGTGAQRTLVYDVGRRSDQTVSVYEVNSESLARQIGVIQGGGRGTLRFAATPDRGVQRIVAQFTLNGIPVPGEKLTVARFRPPPVTLPAPRRLRVRRTSEGLSIRWNAVEGAARYVIAVRQSARGVLELTTGPSRRSVRAAGLDPATGGMVTVLARSSTSVSGATAQTRFTAVPTSATTHRRGHRRRHH